MTTTDVLNAATTIQSRIDTVLATPTLDWANDSGWQPGDPLYAHPWDSDSEDVQYVRSMVQLLHEDQGHFTMIVDFGNDWDFGAVHWRPDCESCEVSWAGPGPCWACGSPATERPSARSALATLSTSNRSDEVPTTRFAWAETIEQWQQAWAESAAEALRPLVEQLNRVHEQLEAARPFTAEQLAALGRAFAEGPPENEPDSDAVIRIPAGACITPVSDLDPALLPTRLPQHAVTGQPPRPESRRYYFNRLATETRRPRRND